MPQTLAQTNERAQWMALAEGVYRWSEWNDEKQLYFNGYVIHNAFGLVILDPPSASLDIFNRIASLGSPDCVVLLNGDHERASDAFRRHFNIPVVCHVADAPALAVPPEKTLEDGGSLPASLHVFHIAHQKTPGEIALYFPDLRAIFVGDALWGKPQGQLTMLPAEKYVDLQVAKKALGVLLDFAPPTPLMVFPGDGEPILENARKALENALA